MDDHVVERPNLAVDGTVTVVLNNGKHFTYRLETVKRGDLKGKRIVSLLIGSDNESSYKGFGFINEYSTAYISVWRKCHTEKFIKHAELLGGMADEHVDQWLQSGRCMKCGRKLTTPESIARGLGPICSERG